MESITTSHSTYAASTSTSTLNYYTMPDNYHNILANSFDCISQVSHSISPLTLYFFVRHPIPTSPAPYTMSTTPIKPINLKNSKVRNQPKIPNLIKKVIKYLNN